MLYRNNFKNKLKTKLNIMKKLTMFTYNRNKMGEIISKNVLRSISVHPTFVGIGANGVAIRDEFGKLAKNLEPSMQGFTVIDL